MNILLGVFTGNEPKYKARRQLCERTWVKGLRDLGVLTVFVKSCQEIMLSKKDDDAIHVLCPNGWEFLPQKTREWCMCALHLPTWTHMVKADDDSYIHPRRFLDFVSTLTEDDHYIGADVGTMQGFPPYASGGAGYVLSRRAATIVAEQLTDKVGHEDKRVGEILLNAGIPFRHDPRFIPFGMHMGWPKRDNDLITSHAITEAAWLAAWSEST